MGQLEQLGASLSNALGTCNFFPAALAFHMNLTSGLQAHLGVNVRVTSPSSEYWNTNHKPVQLVLLQRTAIGIIECIQVMKYQRNVRKLLISRKLPR